LTSTSDFTTKEENMTEIAGHDPNNVTVSGLTRIGDDAFEEILAWVRSQRDERRVRADATEERVRADVASREEEIRRRHGAMSEWARANVP
jgi:hypothetical protein